MIKKHTNDYSFYSKVLQRPFDSLDELKEAEAVHFEQIKAKETKAATKKADASKVEVAFKALNQARKDYKENMLKLTSMYQEDLKKLRDNFEADKSRVHAALADAESTYQASLKAFTDKYPEGYHITLKDGDFETTISGRSNSTVNTESATKALDLFDLLFRL